MIKIPAFLKTKHAFMVFAVIFYALFSFYYMAPSMLNCSDTVYGFGDNTAGPIWRNTVSPSSPLWGHQEITNYPYGENLHNPAQYSGLLQYSWYWTLSKVAGPVCGYNLVNYFGFLSSALVMFGFIWALTKRRWVALLAGYAVAFTPYFQVKVGGHMGYGYQALLIGMIWLFYNLLKHRRLKFAVWLGLLTAVCFYFDPYFSLLSATLLFALGITWTLFSLWRVFIAKVNSQQREVTKHQFKLLLISLITLAIAILPLIFIRLKYSAQINSFVTGSRGNVLFEARACSNLPHEYAVPFVLHPVFGRLFGGKYYTKLIDQLHGNFSCGIGEDSTVISLVIITFAVLGLLVLSWETLKRRRLRLEKILSFEPALVIMGVLAIGLLAMVLALPPFSLGPIPTPSYLLISITETWRTLTRFYLLVNISAVILAAISLSFFAEEFKKHLKVIGAIFIVSFLFIFVEFQAFKPFEGNSMASFSYSKDAPAAYYWLKEQKDIHEIAEYPIEKYGSESDAMSFYLTMQSIHGKKLFNSAMPNNPDEYIRSSLKDLSDPQTLPVLKTLGIDAIVVHGVKPEELAKIPGLKVLYAIPQSPINILSHTATVKEDIIVVAKIVETSNVDKFVSLKAGFARNLLIIKSSIDWGYEALSGSIMSIEALLPGSAQANKTKMPVCFDVRMAAVKDTGTLKPVIDGVAGPAINLTDQYQSIRLEAAESIKLDVSNGHNMQINNLGCK